MARPTRGARRLHRRPRRARSIVARTGADGVAQASAGAACDVGAAPWPSRACCCPCWAAFPISRASRTWPRSRRRPACRPTPCSGSARSAVCVAEDAERLWQRLRLSNAEHERLASMAEAWWRISPADERAPARCSTGWARAFRRPRAAGLGAFAGNRASTPPGARWPRCRSAGPRRCFPSRPRISSDAVCRRARRWARPCRGRGGLDRGGISARRRCRARPGAAEIRPISCGRPSPAVQMAAEFEVCRVTNAPGTSPAVSRKTRGRAARAPRFLPARNVCAAARGRARKGARDVPPLSQGSLYDHDRKLARTAGRRHRVHHAAAADRGLAAAGCAMRSPCLRA